MSAVVRGILVLAALIVVAAGIKAAQALMVPFLLSVFFATIASTPMLWLERQRVPKVIAIILVISALMAILLAVGALFTQSLAQFTDSLPAYQQRLEMLFGSLMDWVVEQGLPRPADYTEIFDPGTALQLAGTTLRGLGGVLSNGFLILLTVIFVLAEASSIRPKLVAALKHPQRDLPHFDQFATTLNRYMAIKASTSVLTGVLVGGFLAIIGVDFPFLWGLLAFFLNFVPAIGSIIAAVPPVLLALMQVDGGIGLALVTAIGFLVTNVMIGNFIEPRFLGAGLGLSALVVLLSLIFWGWMLGPVGMLLAVPLTVTVKIALDAGESTWRLGLLLGPARAAASGREEQSEEQSKEQVQKNR